MNRWDTHRVIECSKERSDVQAKAFRVRTYTYISQGAHRYGYSYIRDHVEVTLGNDWSSYVGRYIDCLQHR